MLLFCPICSNALTITRTPPTDTPPSEPHPYPEGQNRLQCRTCPYQFLIEHKYYERKEMKRKEVEDVLGEEEWKGEQMEAQCPREGCGGAQAFYYQVQIRSADEPMTMFFKCTKCAQRWKEN